MKMEYRERSGIPLQYSALENFVDRGAWQGMYGPWGCKELEMTEQWNMKIEYSYLFKSLISFPLITYLKVRFLEHAYMC